MSHTLVQEVLEYLECERGYSKNTIASYHQDLKDLLQFTQKDLQEITQEDLRSYISTKFTTLSRATLNRRISCYKTTFEYLYETGKISFNPMNGIRTLKQEKRLPECLNFENVKQSINANEINTRDKLMLKLLLTTGIRVSELTSIRTVDIDLQNSSIKIHGKGNKQRIVFITDSETKQLLSQHIANKQQNVYLFTGKKPNKPLTTRRVQYIVKKYLKTHPHALRHTFATYLINKGLDISLVKEILGHENINTTSIYINLTQSAIKQKLQEAFC